MSLPDYFKEFSDPETVERRLKLGIYSPQYVLDAVVFKDGSREVARLALDHGAVLCGCPDKILDGSIKIGFVEGIVFALEHGARGLLEALNGSSMRGFLDVVKWICAKFTNIPEWELGTALVYASWSNNEEIVEWLLDNTRVSLCGAISSVAKTGNRGLLGKLTKRPEGDKHAGTILEASIDTGKVEIAERCLGGEYGKLEEIHIEKALEKLESYREKDHKSALKWLLLAYITRNREESD